jgi:hypothetical protein
VASFLVRDLNLDWYRNNINIGEWGLNISKLIYLIMIQLLIMEIGTTVLVWVVTLEKIDIST